MLEGAVALVWFALVAALELWGRRDPSEVNVLLTLVAVFGLGGWTVALHLRRPLRWVESLWTLARRCWSRVRTAWDLDVGVDFRGRPKVARALPGILWKPTLVLGSLIAVGIQQSVDPVVLRELGARISWCLTALAAAICWVAALLTCVAMAVIVHGTIHDRFVRRRRARGEASARALGSSLRRELGAHGGVAACAVVAAVWAPVSVPLWIAAIVQGLLAIGLVSPLRPRLTLLWRSRARGGAQRSFSLRAVGAAQVAGMMAGAAVLLLALRGLQWRELLIEGAPVSSLLGALLAWAFALGSLALLWRTVAEFTLAWVHDPGRPVRVPVRLLGAPRFSRGEERRWRRTLRTLGLDARFERAPERRLDIRVLVDPGQQSEPTSSGPVALRATLPGLHDPELLRTIQRQFQRRCRRVLLRSLRSLLKRSKERRYRSGEGFWLGIQHWFILGMTRDQQEEETDLLRDAVFENIVGPPFHERFPRAVRHHFLWLCRALEIDLIFIEDGVTFRRLRPVLETLFERFDIHAGSQRAEEHWFRGHPGVRVVIHQFDLERTFGARRFREPDYEDVGRARILHVFRDRGGEVEPVLDPVDLDRVPLVSG